MGDAFHWFVNEPDRKPHPCDFFELGTAAHPDPKEVSASHVGVFLRPIGPESPVIGPRFWDTVEAGQGGPAWRVKGDQLEQVGVDKIVRTTRLYPQHNLLGWLDIDEYFGSDWKGPDPATDTKESAEK